METSEKIIQKLLDFHNLKNGVPEIIREAEKKIRNYKNYGNSKRFNVLAIIYLF